METIEQSIQIALGALQDASGAYTQGRLTDARRLLRFASCEADDLAVRLNAAIANAVPLTEST